MASSVMRLGFALVALAGVAALWRDQPDTAAKNAADVARLSVVGMPLPPPDSAVRIADIQAELQRIGCLDGVRVGDWDAATAEGAHNFAKAVRASIPTEQPTHVLLTLLRGHAAQACGQRVARVAAPTVTASLAVPASLPVPVSHAAPISPPVPEPRSLDRRMPNVAPAALPPAPPKAQAVGEPATTKPRRIERVEPRRVATPAPARVSAPVARIAVVIAKPTKPTPAAKPTFDARRLFAQMETNGR